MGELENHHSCDCRIFAHVPEPQHQLFLFLETPEHQQTIRKTHWNLLKHIIFIVLEIPEAHFCQFGTRRAPTNPEDLSNTILRTLDMVPISS